MQGVRLWDTGKSWHRNLFKPWGNKSCCWPVADSITFLQRETIRNVHKTVNKLRHEWLLRGQDRSKVSFLFIEIRLNQELRRILI